MATIEHEDQGDTLKVWTYPANGSRYTYTFDKESMELTKKTHTTNVATSDKQTKIVAPNMTPSVREYLNENGY